MKPRPLAMHNGDTVLNHWADASSILKRCFLYNTLTDNLLRLISGDGRNLIMIRFRNRVFIDNCFGLCNRLEAFVLACAIQQAFGHEIVLDWPELDTLQVAGAHHGCIGLWGRWGAVRVRSCSPELFQNFAAQRKIILRGFGGPEEKMAAVYDEAASRLSLRPPFAEQVAAIFQRLGPRPVVGVHLRRGDFSLHSEEVYDLHQALLSAVPLWWHEWVMHAIVQRQPDVCFLVCQNGETNAASLLKKNFDVIEVPVANPYRNDPRHRSAHHPVADLFALACCPVILATPVSSFSHYAANVLGNESTCLVPPSRMLRNEPAMVRIRAHKRVLNYWVRACSQKENELLTPSLKGIELDRPADFQWLGPLRER